MYVAERRMHHEASYRRTITNVSAGVRAGAFSPEAVPKIVDGLRAELEQCVNLLLISPQFYTEAVDNLGKLSWK